MSIIDNLLVLLDDGKIKSSDDIIKILDQYSKQTINASLGRILSKKWVIKKNKQYKISSIGQNIVTDTLNHLAKFNDRSINKPCVFIFFNISEKQRIKRDILRNYLSNTGFGRFHNTVWITFENKFQKTNELIKELEIEKNVIIFKATLDANDIKNIINHTNWNFEKLNICYKKFIKDTKNYFNTKKKQNPIFARFLVYQFAKNAANDPKLPKQFLSKKYLGFEAFGLYQKIRNYCY